MNGMLKKQVELEKFKHAQTEEKIIDHMSLLKTVMDSAKAGNKNKYFLKSAIP